MARRTFPPSSQQSTIQTINLPSFYFHFLIIKTRHHVICSRQPYHLEWRQKKRRHQQSFRMRVTQYGAVVNYRWRVCQSYSEPREERSVQPACSK